MPPVGEQSTLSLEEVHSLALLALADARPLPGRHRRLDPDAPHRRVGPRRRRWRVGHHRRPSCEHQRLAWLLVAQLGHHVQHHVQLAWRCQ